MRYDFEFLANLKNIKSQSVDRVNKLCDVDALHYQELILTWKLQQVDIHDVSANENIERVVVVDFGDLIEYRVQLFSINFKNSNLPASNCFDSKTEANNGLCKLKHVKHYWLTRPSQWCKCQYFPFLYSTWLIPLCSFNFHRMNIFDCSHQNSQTMKCLKILHC